MRKSLQKVLRTCHSASPLAKKSSVTFSTTIVTKVPKLVLFSSYTRDKKTYSTMSDEDYEAFLNKANKDVSGSKSQSTSASKVQAVDTEIPASLKKVDKFYTSDADEPFEPVSLKYSGKSLPSTGTLQRIALDRN
jgi:hypothetical protein